MAYRLLMTDIDGTLVPEGAAGPAKRDLDALSALQKKGIPVVLSTGRSSHHLGTPLLGGLVPDYGIFCNGAFVCTGNGAPIYEERLSDAQTREILALGENGDCAVGLTFEDGYYIYYGEEIQRRFHRETFGDDAEYTVQIDPARHLKSRPFSAFGRFPKDIMAQFNTRGNGLRMVPVNARESGHDIVQTHTSKAHGAQKLLEHLGLSFAGVVAIGDSRNDTELIRAAGMGVAVANAIAPLREAADMVTASVEECGVAQAVEKLFFA